MLSGLINQEIVFLLASSSGIEQGDEKSEPWSTENFHHDFFSVIL
jgi:hypothetical protein